MEVVIAPDQKLRVKTKPVKKITPQLLVTLKEMEKLTRTFIDPEGVGLASTQIGQTDQYFVAKLTDDTFTTVFNPKILKYSPKTKTYFEGCLSIPDHYGEVERSVWVEVSYMDISGNQVTKKLTGIPAWIFQHEFDHLQGKLFIDLILEQKSKLFKVIGRDRAGAEVFQEVPL